MGCSDNRAELLATSTNNHLGQYRILIYLFVLHFIELTYADFICFILLLLYVLHASAKLNSRRIPFICHEINAIFFWKS